MNLTHKVWLGALKKRPRSQRPLSESPMTTRFETNGFGPLLVVLVWKSLVTLQPAFGQTSQVFVDSDSDGLSDKYERGVGRYELVSGSFTWQEAKSDAEARGGHLATITIDQEWFSISNLLGSSLAGKAPWLGGSDHKRSNLCDLLYDEESVGYRDGSSVDCCHGPGQE